MHFIFLKHGNLLKSAFDFVYLIRYNLPMYLIKQTKQFSQWLLKLKDIKGKVAVLRRVERVKEGNFGDHKSLGSNISELRVSVGAGYRVYYTKKEDKIIILLVGGDKSTQSKDIEKAKKLCKELEDEELNNI